jgi:hypothetical protein
LCQLLADSPENCGFYKAIANPEKVRMALTSDKLKEMTRRKLGLIKEIDKNTCDERLKGELAALEMEIKGERTKIITDDAEVSAPKPVVAEAPVQKVVPSPKAKVSKDAHSGSADNKVCGTKKLSDFF